MTSPSGALTAQERDARIGELFLALNTQEVSVEEAATLLQVMTDEQVLQVAQWAEAQERYYFFIRGLCALELYGRITVRLRGGRGQVDAGEIGIEAEMCRLAAAMRCSVETLRKDLQIVRTFFVDEAGEQWNGKLPELPRDFYRTALKAPDKLAAVESAATKKAHNPAYSAREFALDVEVLQESAARNEPAPLLEQCHWVNVSVPEEEFRLFEREAEQLSQELGREVKVREILLEAAREVVAARRQNQRLVAVHADCQRSAELQIAACARKKGQAAGYESVGRLVETLIEHSEANMVRGHYLVKDAQGRVQLPEDE